MTPEEERARYISYTQFIRHAMPRYLIEHPVPGPGIHPRRVTIRPRFPEYEFFGFPGWKQKRPVTYFEVYRGEVYLGSTWAVSHGGWMIWRAPDEPERFPSRLGDRLGAKQGCLGFRSKRSQAVRVLLEYPNDPPYPRSVYDHHERWSGHDAFQDFVLTVGKTAPDQSRGRQVLDLVEQLKPAWAPDARWILMLGGEPVVNEMIPPCLNYLRSRFHEEAVEMQGRGRGGQSGDER